MGVSYSSVRPQMVRAAPQLGGGTAGGSYGSMTSSGGDTTFGNGRVQWSSGSRPSLLLQNSFDGGSNTTTITTGNSGGASGNAFSSVSIGSGALTFSNTTYAHGSLAGQFSTGVSAITDVIWTAPVGIQPVVWFRFYAYLTANPGSNFSVFRALASGTQCSAAGITTAGKLTMANGAGSVQLTSANTIPLNQWFRVEGFIIASANAGQVSFSLFVSPDAQVPVETQTSAATVNTTGPVTRVQYGVAASAANIGPFWLDSIGLSNTGPLGPASLTGPASLGHPSRAVIPGRRRGGGGLVVSNQHTPPYVPPGPSPAAPAVDASPLPSLITTFPGTF